MSSEPVSRGYAEAAIDRFATWYLGLDPGQHSYTTQGVQIPMPDGITLAADLFQPVLPKGVKLAGLLLIQSCYGRGAPMSVFSRIFASRGYAILFVSTRGTFGSGGQFDPGRVESRDSQDVVKWMRVQSWYPGTFATFGPSYLGQAQWALLDDPPADCVASAILVGPHDWAYHHWGTGSYRMDRIMWSDMIVRQEQSGSRLWRLVSRIWSGDTDLEPVLRGLPVADSAKNHFGDEAPWVQRGMSCPDLADPFWAPTRHQIALERATAPILLVTGWYDPFTTQTMEQYARLRERGCKVALTAGPWTHLEAGGLTCMPQVVNFLDEHVAGAAKEPRGLAARIYVTGAEEWRKMPVWPPETTPQELYLQADKGLGLRLPPPDAKPTSFTYEPEDPTPTMGGGLLTKGGRVDDSAYAARSDLLVFTSGVVEQDIEVLGKPAVQLAHSSDIPFVDLWVRLSEVDAAGVSHNVSETFQALDPERDASSPVRLLLQDCAHRFCKGTRIRLIVAGGSFPLFARNLGTEGNRTATSEMRSARHTIAYAAGVSKLLLPSGGNTSPLDDSWLSSA